MGAVLIVALLASVLALADPAGNPDVIAGPDSTDDPAADTADTEPDLATPSTTAPATTTTAPTTAPPTTPSTTAPPTTPSTEPPTTAPPPTPSTQPPPTEPPTTPSTEPPTTEPPTTEPPPAPEIVRFTLGTPPGAIFCPDSTHVARRAVWLTEETTGVELTTANGTTAGDSSGSHTFCAPSGSTVTLTATGPGGTVSENRTVG